MSPAQGSRFRSPFFTHLQPATLESLEAASVLRTYSHHETIQLEGDPCAWVSFIILGCVQIFRIAPTGREQILHNLLEGMHFNIVSAIADDSKLIASARSIGKTELLSFPKDHFVKLMQTNSDLSFAVVKDFSKRLEYMTNLVESLSLHSIRGRLAGFLLEQADHENDLDLWTQDEMAAHLGTVRDVIGRTLRSFINSGLIRREGGRLILLDRALLEEESKY